MIQVIVKRLLVAIPSLFAISIVSFAIIQLPEGNYATLYIEGLLDSGRPGDREEAQKFIERYCLDCPLHEQYLKWASGFFRGDFGYAFASRMSVKRLIGERLTMSAIVAGAGTLFIWAIAIPVGVYSGTHQYTIGDYVATLLAFVGRGMPGFLLALIVMWVGFKCLDLDIGGLFSDEYARAPWSLARVWDLLKHLWVPMVLVGLGGTTGLIRTLRANLLDEVRKPYVEMARAKGLAERHVIWKYPVRVALNPFVSGVGYVLPRLVSGMAITGMILGLPTLGPLLIHGLQDQDMYLAGTIILMTSTLTVIGTLLSDILLAWVDPRIRFSA